MYIESDMSYEEEITSNQLLTFEHMNTMFKEAKVEFKEEHKRNLGLYNSGNQYTNLAYLLSDQNEHSVKIAVFDGEDEFRFLDRREFTGSLFSVLKETLAYLHLNNHLQSQIEGVVRVEHWDYDEEIIREGVFNALIHRDYSYSGPTLISVYKDRMEITTLGGLVYGVSFEDISQGISMARNRKLAEIFYRLKLVEAYGTGIKKIRRAYLEYTMGELIHVTDNVFKLILHNRNFQRVDETMIKESAGIYNVYGQRDKEPVISDTRDQLSLVISQLLEEYEGRLVRKVLQERLGVGQTKAGLILMEYVNSGRLMKVGKGKNTYYMSPE